MTKKYCDRYGHTYQMVKVGGKWWGKWCRKCGKVVQLKNNSTLRRWIDNDRVGLEVDE